MIRRDNSQDAERPRNYSSFWIEVAQGKDGGSSASAMLTDEEMDFEVPAATAEDIAEFATPEPPAAPAKPAKSKPTDKKVEPPRSLTSLADLANIDMLMKNSADLGDEAEVDLASDEAEDLDVPLTSDYNFAEGADEELEADADTFEDLDEEDFDEEEEEDDWGGRKTKPSRPQKPRRERRQF